MTARCYICGMQEIKADGFIFPRRCDCCGGQTCWECGDYHQIDGEPGEWLCVHCAAGIEPEHLFLERSGAPRLPLGETGNGS